MPEKMAIGDPEVKSNSVGIRNNRAGYRKQPEMMGNIIWGECFSSGNSNDCV